MKNEEVKGGRKYALLVDSVIYINSIKYISNRKSEIYLINNACLFNNTE